MCPPQAKASWTRPPCSISTRRAGAAMVDQGARRLHLVDLNGAFAGKPKNEAAIKAILKGSRRRDSRAAWRRYPRPRHHRTLS